MVEESVGVAGIIHAAAVVVDSVAHDEVIDLHDQIVAADLIEHALGNLNVRALVFNNHART